MVDEDKLKELKDRIETAKSSNTPITKKNKESGAGFGFKISTEIIFDFFLVVLFLLLYLTYKKYNIPFVCFDKGKKEE